MQGNKKNKMTPLQIRRQKKEALEAQIEKAFAAARREERKTERVRVKRRENDFLCRYLSLSTRHPSALRRADSHRAKSYNLSKQVLGLIDHVFVRYRPPLFLYRSLLSAGGVDLVFGEKVVAMPVKVHAEFVYRSWFLTVAQGGSLAKLAKEVFTKREAHWFLQAPDWNTIPQNILWAKAAAQGLPRPACDYLVRRLDRAFLELLGNRLPDLLRFYAAAWPSMAQRDGDEIMDYIRAVVEDPQFSFKGRTFGSMRKLSHEWHRTLHVGYLREYRSWPGAIPFWEQRTKTAVFRAVELTNNRALADEGKVQKHCVFSYVGDCLSGSCRIVSLRTYSAARGEDGSIVELDRLTLEINPASREIVQIRGKLNRLVTHEEMKILRHWAGVQGLKFSEYMY
jgi:hypothetical protein